MDNTSEHNDLPQDISHVNGMYKNWFLDYASYVILERSVPLIEDGLKPVQRRILHALKDLDDGRFHKVANVVGHSMKYHPHGDASIYDAMVQIGQKDILLDLQGNWGNTLTGDSAAAARYIEVKLSKFALEVVYNSKITEFTPSYDGRGKEPVVLPVKFPLLLAQGVEGIAVGLSTKILPHNFNELIDASIKILKGSKPKIYPDFPNGGMADFSNYNDGLRGGKVRVRAKIEVLDSKTLKISELPHATTTVSLINSILKANDKGKIKIKKIDDNTSERVEILVYLPAGVSPDKTIDALYSFTDCELAISPLGCVIDSDTPRFMGVSEMLQVSTQNTLELLRKELEINLKELQEKWHFSSLEKIFIENRIYRDIEECETWDAVIKAIDDGLKPHIKHLLREVNKDDIVRLTEIKIKRISKFDSFKADEDILKLEDQIAIIKNHLDNLVDYAIDYFKNLKKKYGEKRGRRTEIKTFDNIIAAKVVAKNQKLYVNKEEGFIGTSMRKDEFAFNCSDIDEIIVFRKDGKVVVTKVDKKTFVGKNIIHLAVFKKKDDRTTYNMIYTNRVTKNSYMKRFHIRSSTRDKEYDLTKNGKGEVLYFTSNPNGEAEKVTVHLRALQRLKKLKLDIDFSELAIKGKLSIGNLVCKSPIKKIELKEEGVSTLSARKIWFDELINKLNTEERGKYLGEFEADDKILVIQKSGVLQLLNFDLSRHFNDDILLIEKWKPENPLTAVYFDNSKECYYVKRFIPVNSDKSTTIISDSKGSFLEIITSHPSPELNISFVKERGKDRKEEHLVLKDFIAVKGEKAQGNKLSSKKIHKLSLIEKEVEQKEEEVVEEINKDKDFVKNDSSDEIKTESESDTKIIIDEDSTDNQFKLEL